MLRVKFGVKVIIPAISCWVNVVNQFVGKAV